MLLFDKAQSQFDQKRPFVLYAKPGATKVIGIFQRNSETYEVTDFSENGFVFASFDGTRKLLIPVKAANVIVEQFSTQEYIVSNSVKPTDDAQIQPFEALVNRGVKAISQGNFRKVVLSRSEILDDASFDGFLSFRRLLGLYPNAMRWIWFHPVSGMWIGATPEQLLKVNGNSLETVALAGTKTATSEVVWSEKERDEQQLVTDYILTTLQPFATSIQVNGPEAVQAGNLMHLKTVISAQFTHDNVAQLLTHLHPTPAVCGMPLAPAKDFILKEEGYDRAFYSGYLGELNMDFATYRTENSDLFVTLRCLKYESGRLHIYVGCGITAGSNPEAEYAETVHKAETIKRVI